MKAYFLEPDIANNLDQLKLIGGRSVIRNVAWNLAGTGAPILVALVAVPELIHRLGVARFGALTLAWVVVGYFGLFDIGLGRALTKLAAEFLGQHLESEVPKLFWTSVLLTGLLGFLGMVALAFLTPWLVGHALRIPDTIQTETLRSFYVLSIAMPVVILTGAFRGYLEAHQRFDLVNAVRIPLGIFTYGAPLVVLHFSISLFPIVVVLAAGRAVAALQYALLCLYIDPRLRKGVSWDRKKIAPLFRFGGWMSVSNVVSPLMVMADRFVIGTMLGMAAVAYYATPFEVVTKVLVIPAAIVSVLFPAFSTANSLDRDRMATLYRRGAKFMLLILFPILLATIVFAREGLSLWLGATFASHSARVLEWLAAGTLLNGLALLPFSLVQGVGRPDLTGKLHLAELPVYAVLLWWLIRSRGIEGAAMAWTIRVGADAVVLFLLSHRLLGLGKLLNWRTVTAAAGALGMMCLGATVPGLFLEALFFAFGLVALALAGWFWLLSAEERGLVQKCAWRAAEVSL